jgi:hypothetical protein
MGHAGNSGWVTQEAADGSRRKQSKCNIIAQVAKHS